jgi:hypothetical protein
MRNRSLHDLLREFANDAAVCLSAETAGGAEVPFDVVEERADRAFRGGRRPPLYCYRPLTGAFIHDRLDALAALASYAPAARAIETLEGVDDYLRARGESRPPVQPRERADAALRSFLEAVFADSDSFEVSSERLARAYGELEAHAYSGRTLATVLAPLLGVVLDSDEVDLGDGIALRRGETVADAPVEAVWGLGGERAQPATLAVLTYEGERGAHSPVSLARARFSRLVTTLRLFEPGGAALGPVAWARVDGGPWQLAALAASGRPRAAARITRPQEEELRTFAAVIARRAPRTGEIAWALARFEMACERPGPFEALTDHLLALRALLEPEGPGSGRLGQRVAALCAGPDERTVLAERVAQAVILERAIVAGRAPADPAAEELIAEVGDHARALLRDVLCGHLDPDLPTLADELLAEPVPAT